MTPQNILSQYRSELESTVIKSPSELSDFKNKWLSKKGLIPDLFTKMREVPVEEKKQFGALINEIKNLAEQIFDTANASLMDVSSAKNKPAFDYSLPGTQNFIGALHPLTIVRNDIVSVFQRLGFVISEGPEIVDDFHNFSALNFPADHPARDMQDTFFLARDPDMLLRTHTSSVQVKVMTSQKPPIRTISPGRVFRKDNDSTHSPNFHQIEGIYIDKDVSFADLKQTLYAFVYELFGEDTKVRFRASYFPFTEPSAEMDIEWRKTDPITGEESTRWMEVLGCGMVDPQVLENCGIDPEEYTGFAFGIGIERLAMVRYAIPSIKMLYENDVRFLSQFRGL